MIEFTADGPFSGAKADPLFPDRVRIIGLGQTGAAVCDQLVLHGRPGQDIMIFDTDQQVIEASVVTNRHLLGESVVHGLGCSGDLDLAREIVQQEAARLAETMHGCDFVIVVVGLGSSTGMAIAEHLTQLGRRSGAKIIAVGVQPFAFEGLARRERAISAIATLRAECDSVLVLAHDRLDQNPAAPRNVRHSFHIMHQLMAQGVQALAQVVCKRGLIQLSFADVRSLYGRYQGTEALENCWIAHVDGDIHDTTGELVDRLFNSPLIADESIWKYVDHAIVAVSGTRDLGLSDVQELVGTFKERLDTDVAIATSASLDDEQHDRVRMTVLLAMTAPISSVEKPADVPEQKAKPRLLGDTVPLPSAAAKKARAAKNAAAASTPTAKASASPATAKPADADEVVHSTPAKPVVKPARPHAAPAKPKPAPLPEPELEPEPEPEFVPPVAIIEETMIEQPLATDDYAAEDEIEANDTGLLPEVAEAVAARGGKSARFEAKQEEMEFEPTRGRFEKTHETIYRGENLDQPTYRRRRLAIKL